MHQSAVSFSNQTVFLHTGAEASTEPREVVRKDKGRRSLEIEMNVPEISATEQAAMGATPLPDMVSGSSALAAALKTKAAAAYFPRASRIGELGFDTAKGLASPKSTRGRIRSV